MKPEDKTKGYNKILMFVVLLLFIAFFTLYMSQATGYYEYEQHRKTVFTQEQIKKFEQDVKDGKNINIEDYVTNPNKNYRNNTSNVGYYLSDKISSGVRKGIEITFKFLNKMIESE